jgi:hypothetical protein
MPEIPTPDPDPWSILMGLGMSRTEVDCLQDQGFVAAEYRTYQGARLGPYYKLRWRQDGKQRVKYLGQDVEIIVEVSIALAQLQKKRILERQLARMFLEARKSLRRVKQDMTTAMAAMGEYYHGYTSRKRRTDPNSKQELNR